MKRKTRQRLEHESEPIRDRAAVVKRFCQLSAKVANEKFKWVEPVDCFCLQTTGPIITSGDYIFSEAVIEFIERAVEEKLHKK